MEAAQTVPEWRATADEIWAMLRETAQSQKETEQIVKEIAKNQKETEQQMKETDRQMKETDRRMKEADERLEKQLGRLGNRFGDMVEYMIIPNLVTKFDELGFTFTKANRTEIKDREHGIFTEIDAFLENGDKVMAVEIKAKPSIDDINDHLERMGKLRKYADLHSDRRVYFAAMAGVVFSESERTYALKKGLYVIEPSGDTFNIIEPEGIYHPHEW
jgi:hypothetical protein